LSQLPLPIGIDARKVAHFNRCALLVCVVPSEGGKFPSSNRKGSDVACFASLRY
jgi:hypothetical protein